MIKHDQLCSVVEQMQNEELFPVLSDDHTCIHIELIRTDSVDLIQNKRSFLIFLKIINYVHYLKKSYQNTVRIIQSCYVNQSQI